MDEDDLKWIANEKKDIVIIKQFHDFFVLKPLVVGKSGLFCFNAS